MTLSKITVNHSCATFLIFLHIFETSKAWLTDVEGLVSHRTVVRRVFKTLFQPHNLMSKVWLSSSAIRSMPKVFDRLKFLGIQLQCVGAVNYDVWQQLRITEFRPDNLVNM